MYNVAIGSLPGCMLMWRVVWYQHPLQTQEKEAYIWKLVIQGRMNIPGKGNDKQVLPKTLQTFSFVDNVFCLWNIAINNFDSVVFVVVHLSSSF